MQEHRHFIRWQVNMPAKIKLEGAEVFANCEIKDISFKGMQIILGHKLKKDSFLKLTIVLDDELILDIIEVWVVWHRSIDVFNVYGFYFTKIKDPDKEKIYRFMRRYFPSRLTQQWWQDTKKEGGELMQEKKFEDRRVFARFPVKFPIRFLDLNLNREAEAEAQDISAKGIGMVTDTELSPRLPLEMWLDIPDEGEPFYTRGEVVWSKPCGTNQYRVGINLEKADLMGLARALRTTEV